MEIDPSRVKGVITSLLLETTTELMHNVAQKVLESQTQQALPTVSSAPVPLYKKGQKVFLEIDKTRRVPAVVMNAVTSSGGATYSVRAEGTLKTGVPEEFLSLTVDGHAPGTARGGEGATLQASRAVASALANAVAEKERDRAAPVILTLNESDNWVGPTECGAGLLGITLEAEENRKQRAREEKQRAEEEERRKREHQDRAQAAAGTAQHAGDRARGDDRRARERSRDRNRRSRSRDHGRRRRSRSRSRSRSRDRDRSDHTRRRSRSRDVYRLRERDERRRHSRSGSRDRSRRDRDR